MKLSKKLVSGAWKAYDVLDKMSDNYMENERIAKGIKPMNQKPKPPVMCENCVYYRIVKKLQEILKEID